MNDGVDWPKDDAERIRRARAVEGGHLGVGGGGYTLYYGRGATLSGYDIEPMKADCIAAGVPVIDGRALDSGIAMQLAYRSPMIAIGQAPSPKPWHALAYAPLQHVADIYRAAGAEVINLPPS